MKILSTQDLATFDPEAFAALPIPYQNDDCLRFFFFHMVEFQKMILHAAPKKDQIEALGDWLCYFDPIEKLWLDCFENIKG